MLPGTFSVDNGVKRVVHLTCCVHNHGQAFSLEGRSNLLGRPIQVFPLQQREHGHLDRCHGWAEAEHCPLCIACASAKSLS